jgi:phosphoesterase RecJ-like protein
LNFPDYYRGLFFTFGQNHKMTFRFPEKEIHPVKTLLSTPKKIVITTHHRPDGDAMGSSLALYNYLLLKGHDLSLITPSDYPEFLHWLPGNSKVINYEDQPQMSRNLLEAADVIFCLDFNDLKRTEKMETALRESNAIRILIDHHLYPEQDFTHLFSYSSASSTCELVYQFIEAMGDLNLVDKSIAECIYCGIMTDTNSFRYSSMHAATHRIIAFLMEAGAENHRIHERIYDSNTENRLRLLGYSLKEKLVIMNKYKTAYISLSEAELKMFNFRPGDTEGLVNYALSIEGIVLAAFFSEKDGLIKISFRSKGDFSVQELSSVHFKGGGHRNASGGIMESTLQEALDRFLSLLPMYEKQLNRQDEQ